MTTKWHQGSKYGHVVLLFMSSEECWNTWGWWPLESMQSWVYTIVHWATEACCYRSKGRFYKGTLHTYTLKNCSLNVLLRDWLTAALSIHPFPSCLSIIISLTLPLSHTLSYTLFTVYRCLVLCIKHSPVDFDCWIFHSFSFLWGFFFQSTKRNFNHPSLLLYHSLFILLHPTDISCLCGNVLSTDVLGIIITKWTDPSILHCITTRQTTTHFHPHAVSVLTNEPHR